MLSFKFLKQKPPNVVTFPKVYVETIWLGMPLSGEFDVKLLKPHFDMHVLKNVVI